MTPTRKLTEQQIFDAATEIFMEKGLTGARMQEIADQAGINKAMLHYYYRSKEKLFDSVFEKVAASLFQKLIISLDNDLPFEEKIRTFYQEHIQFLENYIRELTAKIDELTGGRDFEKRIRSLEYRIEMLSGSEISFNGRVQELQLELDSLKSEYKKLRPILDKIEEERAFYRSIQSKL